MFERNRVDNVPDTNPVPVEITLSDGTLIKGKLLIAVGRTLYDVLNGQGGFLEFEPYGGERTYLSRAQIAWVRLVGVPRAPNLAARMNDIDGFDPHAVLGVSVGAGRDEVREAYFRRAKAYHPDRYATAELPTEVREYLAAMARRINAAHAALDAPQKKQAARAEPVFTSPPRA